MTDRLKVGVVTSVHGIKGEVKVFPTTDDSRRFKKLKQVYLDTGKELLSLEIEGVKFFKQMVILKFKGYENPDDVMKFRQKELWIDRKDAVRLSKDEYFIADLIDMEVCDEEGKDTVPGYGEGRTVYQYFETCHGQRTYFLKYRKYQGLHTG